jgi:hypothetical protein
MDVVCALSASTGVLGVHGVDAQPARPIAQNQRVLKQNYDQKGRDKSKEKTNL